MSPNWRSSRGRKGIAVVVAALVVVSTVGIAFAVPATAAEQYGPASTTYVDSCGTLDDAGVYILRNDVTVTDGDCFRVTADDVTLLGAGHTLYGTNTSGAAVVASGVSGLHLEGLETVGWWNAVELTSVEGATIRETAATNSSGDGIRVADSSDVVFENGSITGAAGHGVVVVDSDAVEVVGASLVDNTGDGVAVRRSVATSVRDSLIANNGGMGVRVGVAPEQEASASTGPPSWLLPMLGSSGFDGLDALFTPEPADDRPGLTVSDNRIVDNRYEGVMVTQVNRAVVANNTVSGATDGIHVVNASAAVVDGNAVSGSTDDGIVLAFVTDSNVSGNEVTENGDDGVYLIGSNNELRGNVFTNNTDDGLDLDGGANNTILENVARGNVDDGIYLRESDGNRIVGNRLHDNTDDGFGVRGSTANVVTNNSVCGNENRDLQVRTGVTGNEVHDNSAEVPVRPSSPPTRPPDRPLAVAPSPLRSLRSDARPRHSRLVPLRDSSSTRRRSVGPVAARSSPRAVPLHAERSSRVLGTVRIVAAVPRFAFTVPTPSRHLPSCGRVVPPGRSATPVSTESSSTVGHSPLDFARGVPGSIGRGLTSRPTRPRPPAETTAPVSPPVWGGPPSVDRRAAPRPLVASRPVTRPVGRWFVATTCGPSAAVDGVAPADGPRRSATDRGHRAPSTSPAAGPVRSTWARLRAGGRLPAT
ncbi:right-handed parallel beta-helix repeat-containing protein [Halobaculum litoreum]|uniref:Right-handed parallel beta-helix repeat-containing protein n=1 Tax=Halobaculum litoreum TaxID=3031998 RepID=A0ABD5XWK4_9EURY